MSLKNQPFAPIGRMNQDDSLINPGKDMAGKNPFQLGDYRYALNLRLGSSRSDNFNDGENIKGTEEVTAYKVRSVVNTNYDFSSGLTGWSQQAATGGTAWTVSGGVIVSVAAGSKVSDILYQSVAPSGKRLGVRVKLDVNYFTSTCVACLYFMNGSTILKTHYLFSDIGDGVAVNRSYSKYVNTELPDGCNRVGLQVFITSLLGTSIEAEEFKFYDWISGSRPSGNERVIGRRDDKENNLLYYCVYNDDDNHCLRVYNGSDNSVYELLKWSGLGFLSNRFVSMALIDNFISITDRNKNPRLIDVNTISDLYLILGSNFREYHISFHKWAPVMPPVLKAFYDGANNNYKKFENKVIQISYRYIYQSNLKSRWSPISAVAQNFLGNSGNEITNININIPGFFLDTPGASVQYNYFDHDDVQFTDFVNQIEIAYRESSLDVWRVFKRYDVKVSNNMSFSFEDQSNSTPVPVNDFVQVFDTVPFLAGTVESIDNRFVFGDCLDEKDIAPPLQVESIGVASFDANGALGDWWNAGASDSADNQLFFPSLSGADADELGNRNRISDSTFKGRGKYKAAVQWMAENGWRSGGYTSDEFIFEIPEEDGIIDKLYALEFKFPSTFRPPDWAVAYQVLLTNCLNIDYFMFGPANSFDPIIDNATAFGDKTEVPEYLRDRIRQHFENARIVTGRDYDDYLKTLSKKPFQKSVVSDVRRTAAAAALSDASRLYINVNCWYNSSKKNNTGSQNNPMNNLYYNYREGDRVRFLASTQASPTTNQKVVYDVPILEFTGIGLIVEKPDGIQWLPSNGNVDSDYIIEVYTPKTAKDSDYIYYERGEWYPVLYPGTEQRDMAKRDWTYSDNIGITCTTYGNVKVFNNRPMSYGDCHGIFKEFWFDYSATLGGPGQTSEYLPSMNPDLNKMAGTFNEGMQENFWEKNVGRPAFAYTDLPLVEFKKTQVRFGGQKVEQSNVNNINRFRDEDQKIYPSEYGRIRSLICTQNAQVESVGTILLAIGERETFSIYVNRTTFEDLSGRSTVALSDKILGSYNTLLGSHGTINPESVCIDRGRIYFWDGIDGVWVRYGRDGLTEISFYKMRNWFRELSQLLISQYGDDSPWIISELDAFNEELVTYIDHASLPSTFRGYSSYKGSIFSEEDTGWKGCHSYTPELMGKVNSQLVCFFNGGVFLTEKSETRSTFFGTKYDVMIEPVFNNEVPYEVKIHQSISIIATHKWSVERFLSEYRGAKTVQESFIPLDAFEDREDNYYADIKNDINSPITTNPYLNGNKMRSKALRALLKLDPTVTTQSLLHYVVITDIDSPKNP